MVRVILNNRGSGSMVDVNLINQAAGSIGVVIFVWLQTESEKQQAAL